MSKNGQKSWTIPLVMVMVMEMVTVDVAGIETIVNTYIYHSQSSINTHYYPSIQRPPDQRWEVAMGMGMEMRLVS